MAERSNPHDEFFKYAFGRPETARDFLSNCLPAEVAALLDLATLELAPGSFVDAQLRAHLSDLLYEVKLRDGRDAYVYMLFEHKSNLAPKIAFQLLKYMVRIWERASREKMALAPIVPVVVYHGAERWCVGRNFQSLLDLPVEMAPYVPEYRYWLYDLSEYTDEELKGAVVARAMLWALKHIYDGRLRERAPQIVSLFLELAQCEDGLEYIKVMLRYFADATDRLDQVDLARIVEAVFPEGGDELMATVAEKWRQEGIVEGIELVLDVKFGADGLRLLSEIREIKDIKKLRAVQRALKIARTPDEVRRVYLR